MNQDVTNYIQKLPKWQIEVCEHLRKLIFGTIPDVVERLQYGKPHYLKMVITHQWYTQLKIRFHLCYLVQENSRKSKAS